MLLEMFVNELSLVPAAANVPAGQERARQFVLTMIAATARGVKRILRLPEDFFAKAVAPSYNWYHWLSDNRVDREIRQYFRSLATKAPFLHDVPSTEAVWAGIDCYWDAQPAFGFKAAYVADGLALSLLSRPEWDYPLIACEIQEIVDQDISCRSESIHHASSPCHIEQQTDWIQSRIQTIVADGSELWHNFEDFFPSLVCCSGVEQHMADLPSESLASITRGLFRLNSYGVSWQSGRFDPNRIECSVSPESESTLQLFADESTFLCPDGKGRVFSWHAKVGKWRIYFDPFPGPGRLLVGYVGKHLSTAKFH
jgi:hypothetical protein